MTITSEARELVELAKVDELVTEYDVEVGVVLEGRQEFYKRAERKARTKVTRATTDLAKARRSLGWSAERRSDLSEVEAKVAKLESRLERRLSSLAERAHQLREADEALDFFLSTSPQDC